MLHIRSDSGARSDIYTMTMMLAMTTTTYDYEFADDGDGANDAKFVKERESISIA